MSVCVGHEVSSSVVAAATTATTTATTAIGINTLTRSSSSQLNPDKILISTSNSFSAREFANELIFKALKDRVESVNKDTCDAGGENSFFVCDLGEIERLYRYWRAQLPRVQPFYAVKCNPNEKVLNKLASLGVNFDCASKSEIEKALSCGVEPNRIIYANPCKASSFIRFAYNKGVEKLTFDNLEELYKIAKFYPSAKLLLRILTDDSSAQCSLSTKYGCDLRHVDQLLLKVQELSLNLIGVSFHIGSGATDFSSIAKAVADSRVVFNKAKEMGLPPLHMLDVGGGFQFETFHESSSVLASSLEEHFSESDPENAGLTIIAEPGRFLVATSFTLASHVIAKRKFDESQSQTYATTATSSEETMIYINDGIYANMNCILFDHQDPTARILYHKNQFHYMDHNTTSKTPTPYCTHKVSIWGPTCDGLDCITREYYMKYDIEVGDWMYFPNFGAYTSSAATPFNGFEQSVDVIYIDSESA